MTFKKTLGIYLLVLTQLSVAHATPLSQWLVTADSLFLEKQYPESFELYQKVLGKGEAYTPNMLLKMAYIKDGQKQHAEALYYLTRLYSIDKNKNIQLRITELAIEHSLEGYQTTDQTFFTDLIDQHKHWLTGFGVILVISTIARAIWLNAGEKNNKPSQLLALGMWIVFLLLFNLRYKPPQAIIKDVAVLMEAPSAGANQVDQIKKGHRVPVYGKEDIWVKILWQDQIAYIRADNLLML